MLYLRLQLFRAEVEYRGKTNDHTALQSVGEATSTAASELLRNDELVEVVELGAGGPKRSVQGPPSRNDAPLRQ